MQRLCKRGGTMTIQKTLEQLEAGGMARVQAIAFLKYFKWEQLTSKQLLKVLAIIEGGKK